MPANGEGYSLDTELFEQLTAAKGWLIDRERAAGIGVNLTTVWRVRTGKTKPSAEFIAKASAALGVPVEKLFKAKTPVGV